MKFKRIISLIVIAAFISTLGPAPNAFALRAKSTGENLVEGEVARAIGAPAAAAATGRPIMPKTAQERIRNAYINNTDGNGPFYNQQPVIVEFPVTGATFTLPATSTNHRRILYQDHEAGINDNITQTAGKGKVVIVRNGNTLTVKPSGKAGAAGRTPLYEWHKANGGKVVDFHGWELPTKYATKITDEHMAVRQAAGLFDIAHMGVLEVRGDQAEALKFLEAVTTNNVSNLLIGGIQYSYIPDENGNLIDDIMVYRLKDRYLLVVNASNTQRVKEWLDSKKPGNVTVDNMREEQYTDDRKVMLALQGPQSLKILQKLSNVDLSKMNYFTSQEVELGGIKVLLSRTGYTGERGYEIFVHPDRAVELWEKLLEAGKTEGVMPCGLAARDSLRLEAGLPLYGNELAGDLNLSPFEAGFGDFVDFDKGDFIGRAALLQKKAAAGRQVVTLLLTGKEEGAINLAIKGVPMPNPGTTEIHAKGRDGKWVKLESSGITSRAVDSPTWRKEGFVSDAVKLTAACIEGEFAAPGTELKIVTGGRECYAVVLPRGFYDNAGDRFAREYEPDYIPVTDEENAQMLAEIGVGSVEELFDSKVPADLIFHGQMDLPPRLNRLELFLHLLELSRKNRPASDAVSFLGAGAYQRNIPAVVDEASGRREIYTPYTPYQPELMQGNLEAIYLFQSLVCKLTGMEVANASMYEAGSAMAEAALMAYRITNKGKSRADATRKKIIVAGAVNPFHKEVLDTYAGDVGLEVVVSPLDPQTGRVDMAALNALIDENTACVIVQQPNFFGCLESDLDAISEATHSKGALLVTSVDLMSLANLRPPSEYGADIVVGEGQSFGNRLNFGGPGLGIMATKQSFARQMPGRIVGKTVDNQGNEGYVLTLQPREQHVQREKATSNICSNEALCAFNAAAYLMAVAHNGNFQRISMDSHVLAADAAEHIEAIPGFGVLFPSSVYNEFVMASAIPIDELNKLLREEGIVGGLDVSGSIPGGNYCLLSFTDTTTPEDVGKLLTALRKISQDKQLRLLAPAQAKKIAEIEQKEKRGDDITDAIPGLSTSQHRAYFKWLASLNYSIDKGLYPLGSCTMKYNPKINEDIAMLPRFTGMHPAQPIEDAQGTLELMWRFQEALKELLGFGAVTLQPAAGSHGELTGIKIMRAYHRAQGHPEKNLIITPESSHGTNPASAAMAQFDVLGKGKEVKTAPDGTIDLDDLKRVLAENKGRIAGIMITNPNTLGIFEKNIEEICRLIHEAGGLVYMDGANLNAIVGRARPGDWGVDVMHINLHKTFATPHGGGGPGSGPVLVRKDLERFLPKPTVERAADGTYYLDYDRPDSIGRMHAAFGNVNVVVKAYTELCALGLEGLRRVSGQAVVNANYMAARIAKESTNFISPFGTGMHEFVIRPDKEKTGETTTLDIAKYLIDCGVHPPTIYFPLNVHDALMIEPTETAYKAWMDKFCDALIKAGELAASDDPADHAKLKNAPTPKPGGVPVGRLNEALPAKDLGRLREQNISDIPGIRRVLEQVPAGEAAASAAGAAAALGKQPPERFIYELDPPGVTVFGYDVQEGRESRKYDVRLVGADAPSFDLGNCVPALYLKTPDEATIAVKPGSQRITRGILQQTMPSFCGQVIDYLKAKLAGQEGLQIAGTDNIRTISSSQGQQVASIRIADGKITVTVGDEKETFEIAAAAAGEPLDVKNAIITLQDLARKSIQGIYSFNTVSVQIYRDNGVDDWVSVPIRDVISDASSASLEDLVNKCAGLSPTRKITIAREHNIITVRPYEEEVIAASAGREKLLRILEEMNQVEPGPGSGESVISEIAKREGFTLGDFKALIDLLPEAGIKDENDRFAGRLRHFYEVLMQKAAERAGGSTDPIALNRIVNEAKDTPVAVLLAGRPAAAVGGVAAAEGTPPASPSQLHLDAPRILREQRVLDQLWLKEMGPEQLKVLRETIQTLDTASRFRNWTSERRQQTTSTLQMFDRDFIQSSAWGMIPEVLRQKAFITLKRLTESKNEAIAHLATKVESDMIRRASELSGGRKPAELHPETFVGFADYAQPAINRYLRVLNNFVYHNRSFIACLETMDKKKMEHLFRQLVGAFYYGVSDGDIIGFLINFMGKNGDFTNSHFMDGFKSVQYFVRAKTESRILAKIFYAWAVDTVLEDESDIAERMPLLTAEQWHIVIPIVVLQRLRRDILNPDERAAKEAKVQDFLSRQELPPDGAYTRRERFESRFHDAKDAVKTAIAREGVVLPKDVREEFNLLFQRLGDYVGSVNSDIYRGMHTATVNATIAYIQRNLEDIKKKAEGERKIRILSVGIGPGIEWQRFLLALRDEHPQLLAELKKEGIQIELIGLDYSELALPIAEENITDFLNSVNLPELRGLRFAFVPMHRDITKLSDLDIAFLKGVDICTCNISIHHIPGRGPKVKMFETFKAIEPREFYLADQYVYMDAQRPDGTPLHTSSIAFREETRRYHERVERAMVLNPLTTIAQKEYTVPFFWLLADETNALINPRARRQEYGVYPNDWIGYMRDVMGYEVAAPEAHLANGLRLGFDDATKEGYLQTDPWGIAYFIGARMAAAAGRAMDVDSAMAEIGKLEAGHVTFVLQSGPVSYPIAEIKRDTIGRFRKMVETIAGESDDKTMVMVYVDTEQNRIEIKPNVAGAAVGQWVEAVKGSVEEMRALLASPDKAQYWSDWGTATNHIGRGFSIVTLIEGRISVSEPDPNDVRKALKTARNRLNDMKRKEASTGWIEHVYPVFIEYIENAKAALPVPTAKVAAAAAGLLRPAPSEGAGTGFAGPADVRRPTTDMSKAAGAAAAGAMRIERWLPGFVKSYFPAGLGWHDVVWISKDGGVKFMQGGSETSVSLREDDRESMEVLADIGRGIKALDLDDIAINPRVFQERLCYGNLAYFLAEPLLFKELFGQFFGMTERSQVAIINGNIKIARIRDERAGMRILISPTPKGLGFLCAWLEREKGTGPTNRFIRETWPTTEDYQNTAVAEEAAARFYLDSGGAADYDEALAGVRKMSPGAAAAGVQQRVQQILFDSTINVMVIVWLKRLILAGYKRDILKSPVWKNAFYPQDLRFAMMIIEGKAPRSEKFWKLVNEEYIIELSEQSGVKPDPEMSEDGTYRVLFEKLFPPTDSAGAGAAAAGAVNIDDYLAMLKQDNSWACDELKMLYRGKWEARRQRMISAIEQYKILFPHITHAVISRAPGRITANEHTDYNDAVALGMPTIQDDIAIAGVNPDGNSIELRNMEEKFPAATFASTDAVMGMEIQPKQNKSDVAWSEFFVAVLQSLFPRLAGLGAEIPGMCILIDGREDFGGVPLESNISSSAAFEESAIYAIEALVGVRGKLTAGEAIEIGREAEAKIGFPCGKLDQGSSIVTREITPTGKIMGAAIDCVPRLDEAGRDKTVIIPFEIPAELQAVLVNSGPKGDAQREYNIRVLEGELASWILARFLNELSPDFAQDPDKIRAAVAGLYSDINPDHNGKPYLYDKDRVYPVFLKPAFFAGNRLRELDVDITDEEVIAWVKRMFPDGITMQELFDNFSLPKEFFDLAAAACKKINIPVESMSFNLRGTALHAITEEQRAPLIMQALKDAVEAQTDEAKIAALKRFGELQREGYESLRDNYRNSTPDIDRLVGWAGQQPWSLSVGSDRHFGAGWGGWVEVWVMPDMVDIAQRALTEHLEAPPRDLMPYEPGAPASIFAQVAAADEPMTAEEAANNKDGPKPAAAAAAGVADVGEAIAAFKALREAIAAERAGNYTAGLTAATDAAYENFRVIYARDILPHYTPADAEITYHPGGIKLALSTERNSALSQYSTVRIVQSWQDETDVALRYRANVIYKVAIESVRLAAAKCPTEGLSVLEYATIPENSIVAVPGVLFTGELAVADVFMLPEIMGKFRASNTRLVIGGLSDAQKEVLTAWVGEESVTQGWVIFDNAINNSGASVPAVALLGIAQKYGVDENNVYDFVPIKPGYKAVNPEFYSIVDLTPLVRQFTLPEEGQYLSLSKLFNEAFVMQGNPEALINAILPALPEGLAEPLEELRKTIREAAAIGASV